MKVGLFKRSFSVGFMATGRVCLSGLTEVQRSKDNTESTATFALVDHVLSLDHARRVVWRCTIGRFIAGHIYDLYCTTPPVVEQPSTAVTGNWPSQLSPAESPQVLKCFSRHCRVYKPLRGLNNRLRKMP